MELNKIAVKVAMAERELNQKQLANKAGMEESTLSCILTGKSKGRPETWGKIAKGLGLTVLDIIKTD